MSKHISIALAAAFLLTLVSPTIADQMTPPSIASLKSDGWKIIEKSEKQKSLPGLPPYENLVRIVQTSHYRLQKADATMICNATYDSQRDRYEEECHDAGN